MTPGTLAVAVKQFPNKWSAKQARIFLRDIESCTKLNRPRVVLDCSNLPQIDRSVIHVLLRCLEEAMKSNGDVKLAAIPPGALGMLELTGVTRLFDIFDTPAEAMNSFHQLPADAGSQATLSHGKSESAA